MDGPSLLGLNPLIISWQASQVQQYKASGIGREWGVEGIEEYLETKLIAWRT